MDYSCCLILLSRKKHEATSVLRVCACARARGGAEARHHTLETHHGQQKITTGPLGWRQGSVVQHTTIIYQVPAGYFCIVHETMKEKYSSNTRNKPAEKKKKNSCYFTKQLALLLPLLLLCASLTNMNAWIWIV